MSERLERITRLIEQYADDVGTDQYHAGFDEAWDEARNKGFDEGYESFRAEFLNEFEGNDLFMTPETIEQLQNILKDIGVEGMTAAAFVVNFIRKEVESL